MRTTPVDGVRSTLRNFRLGGLAERAKATPVLRTYYGDTKYQLGNITKPLISHLLEWTMGCLLRVQHFVWNLPYIYKWTQVYNYLIAAVLVTLWSISYNVSTANITRSSTVHYAICQSLSSLHKVGKVSVCDVLRFHWLSGRLLYMVSLCWTQFKIPVRNLPHIYSN